jgi:hypothetical protein
MADYTSDEIQAAVERVVRSSIRRPYGTLGNRDAGATFNDLQDAAAGVYILKPNAPFYTVFLGAQRLLGLLADEEQTLLNLVEAIENVNRHVTEIDNLAPLNNARAALDALSNAAGSRNSIFSSIEDVPAFQRYDQNVQRFLDESAKNARSRGQLVPTPQESRASLAGLVRTLRTQHEVTLSRSLLLTQAIDDYDGLQLPSLIAAGVISKARAVLQSRIEELTALSPKDRLGKIRDVTLDLLAGRAAVTGLGSLRATTTFALIEGAGTPFADTDHPATPASLPTNTGPFPIWPERNTLDFILDGSFSFSALIPGSFLAKVTSALPEPYIVSAGENDVLMFSADTPAGLIDVSVTLTAGARTADEIAVDINAALPPLFPLISEAVLSTTKFVGVVDSDATGSSSDIDFILPSPGTWDALGVRAGDVVRVTDTLSLNFGSEFEVDVGGIAGDTITCTQVSGPAPADETLIEVEAGSGHTVRIRIADGFEQQALDDRIGIVFTSSALNTALIGGPLAPQSLGFRQGSKIYSRSTSAEQVTQDVPKLSPSTLSGVPRLDASTDFVPAVFEGLGRSDPDNPNKLIAYKMWVRTDAPAGTLGVVFSVLDADSAGVIVGDTLVIRETPVSADINVKGVITAVDDTSITVDMDQSITGGSDLQIEVGPTLVLTSQYLEAQVTDSESQDGTYFMDVRGQGSIPFELTMEGLIPFNRSLGGRPAFFTLGLGASAVLFTSTKTDLTTNVRVETISPTSAVPSFFSFAANEATGSTKFFQLPEDPRTLQVGDTLEVYETTYNIVSNSFQITGLELSELLIELDPEIDTEFGTINMSQVAQPPFARIRLSKKNNYTIFEQLLSSWVALSVNQEAWFTELSRLLNPLIANENPTAAAVNSARTHVVELLSVFTRAGAIGNNAEPDDTLESILTDYFVEPVEEVDVLVETYLERGATRGIDLLLQGQFNVFFGLTLEGMTYDGAARAALRDVQRLDLPIKKTGRTQNLDNAQTLAEWEDPDFEFDQSDTENAVDVEIPGDFSEITPPGR